MAATEVVLDSTLSLMRRLELLSSMAFTSGPSQRKAQEGTFACWLALSPRRQLADLSSYFKDSGSDPRLAMSEECYRTLVPLSATEVEKRLSFCGLRVALASLRNRHNSGRLHARRQVGRMLDLARQGRGRLSIEEVSRSVGVSRRHLGRLFTQGAGVAFRRYSLWLRILNAVALLRGTTQPVKAIASLVGYADPSNFVREFHNTLGTTPRDFRERFCLYDGGNEDA